MSHPSTWRSETFILNLKELNMYAIEFEADTNNGVVRIPEQFKEFSNTHVKIVMMMPQKPSEFKRTPGSAKGKIKSAPDIDKPLTEDQLKDFYGK